MKKNLNFAKPYSFKKEGLINSQNKMHYKRILLKLSGEALMGNRNYGIDPKRLSEYAKEIKEVV